ncbi:MAG: 50S ribosomal protein L40e [DPANN group archaeon]|jgi:ribosomal protein L40E|nr:50S ribosomal protein L40e [DPANN group archaeon]
MAKVPEAMARLFGRKWVCRRCKTVIKGDSGKIRAGEIHCPKCGQRHFRPKSKEKRILKGK